ncbi:MAG: hypothetical protein LBL43_03505 [Treponema sp.]|jgi:hypothetical protein|nr:hypothetical protein [Treponema sp.]
MGRRFRLSGAVLVLCVTALVRCQAQLDPRADEGPLVPVDSLEGTVWYFSAWGGTTLEFVSPGEARNDGVSSAYTYNGETRSGQIEGLGPFTMSRDGKTMTVFITKYGHNADFILQENKEP